MANWEPDPVRISNRTIAGVLFVSVCCFVAGALLYFYGV